MARVTVSVNVRDMTRGDLQRLRGRLDGLTRSVNSFAGSGSQRNLEIMQRNFRQMDAQVRSLAGHIPHDEFDRLSRRVADFGVRMNSTGMNSQRQLALMRTSLRDINREISRVGAGGERRIAITAEDRTGPGLRQSESRIRRWAMGPLRGLGGLIGGTLSDGVGQGIMGAFRSPTFGTAIVAAIAGALALAGAAIAGALIFALGAAFVGVAAMSAAKAEEVQRTWKAAAKNMGEDLKQAGEPLIPVLQRAIGVLESMSDEFAPHFREAMEKAVPHLDTFIQRTKEGFKKMGQGAWDDLQQAFRVFTDAFGPEWESFLEEFGKSLGALARTVSSHSTEMAMALGIVLGAITFLIDAVNFLAQAWVFMLNQGSTVMAFLIRATAATADGILLIAESIVKGFDFLTSWIPDLDGQLKKAGESIERLRGTTREKFENMAQGAEDWGRRLDESNKERVLKVDIDSWNSQLSRALEKLKTVPPSQQTALKGEISDLRGKIDAANEKLRSMQKDYYVRIHAYKVGDWAIGMGGPYAHGGVIGHVGRAATGGARSNMTLVGEQGPEFVNLAPGSHVRSAADTRRIAAQGGGEGGGSTLVLQSSGRRVDDLLVEILREAIHQRGGDPVTVLGGRSA